jgi:hypothetical protein
MTVTVVGPGNAEHMERCGVLLIDERDGARYAVPFVTLATFCIARDELGDTPRYEVTAEELAPYLLTDSGHAGPSAALAPTAGANRLPVAAVS